MKKTLNTEDAVVFSTLVIDASAAVDALLEDNPKGEAVAHRIRDCVLIAPTMFAFEVTNVIRRRLSARILSPEAAQLAWIGLNELDVELWQWATIANRVWRLRGSLSAYDASYIALAEVMNCPLVTTDARLAAMAPSTCQVELVGCPAH